MKKIINTLLTCLLFLSIANGQPKDKSSIWEKFKSSGPELKHVGWLVTKHSKDIDSSPWSVGCETLDRDYADFEVYKDYVGELGVKHARLQSGWAKCEKEKGIYNFDWLDKSVYGLVEQGVAPWISLSYGNPIYNSEINLGSRIFTDEETMTAWCNYVEAVVFHYKDVVKDWEIWNEPRHSESPEAYANLMIRTSEVIKKVQPHATIMGFTVHGFSPKSVLKFPQAVLEILKAKDKLDIVNYVTYHPYTYNPDECYPMVDELEELVQSYNPRLKLYQGESGAPSEYRETMALSKYPWTELSQAKWMLRRLLGDYIRDIPSSAFTIIDLKYPHEINRKGIIHLNEDKSIDHPKIAYYGVKNVAGFFVNEVKSTGQLEYVSDTHRNLTVAGVDKNNKKALLLWFDDQIPDNKLQLDQIDLTVDNLNLINPVYVELISGKVYEIEKKNWNNTGKNVRFENLPIWDSPVMIADRSMVELKTEND